MDPRDSPESPAPSAPAVGLRIYVLAIGQADSMLIVGPGPQYRTLLVDCGEEVHPAAEGDAHLRYHQVARDLRGIFASLPGGAAQRRRLDYFMVSHMHVDHVGNTVTAGEPPSKRSDLAMSGIRGLMEQEGFTVGTWIDVGDEAREYVKGKSEAGVFQGVEGSRVRWNEAGLVGRFVRPQFGTAGIDLGPGVTLDIVAYAGRVDVQDPGIFRDVVAKEGPKFFDDAPASENDLSIAFVLKAGEFEMFTGGDLSGVKTNDESTLADAPTHSSDGSEGTYCNVEARLLRHWLATNRECDVEVYRANHHGEDNASTKYFVDALDPEFVLYSCGGDYDHPSKAVVERARATARMFVTTALSKKTWPQDEDFEKLGGTIVGKRGKGWVEIAVAADGRSYWIDGERHTAFTDFEEARQADQGEERARR
jgi:hypothetical protein